MPWTSQCTRRGVYICFCIISQQCDYALCYPANGVKTVTVVCLMLSEVTISIRFSIGYSSVSVIVFILFSRQLLILVLWVCDRFFVRGMSDDRLLVRLSLWLCQAVRRTCHCWRCVYCSRSGWWLVGEAGRPLQFVGMFLDGGDLHCFWATSVCIRKLAMLVRHPTPAYAHSGSHHKTSLVILASYSAT